MRVLFQLLFFLSISFFKGQDLNKLANLSSKIENEREIRIYVDNGITNSGKIFRIYQENNNKWNAEVIQWFLPEKISEDEFEMIPAKVNKLKSKDILEKAFVNIEAMNIGHLPKEENFNYKTSKSKAVYDDENGYVLLTREISITDGVGFSVKYKSNKKENEFHYSNPKSYLKDTPGIDEYESFMKILKYVENNFNIQLD
ncbi:hypothetical protein CEY12_17395 [Chryseobacterium sp. T16E-39]|uniref:hypothetical protein n=1 Tax=Chryseobacterium sp. T16E-39 TaxID=2015076 RepID=UPI000B5B2408|nr:hypothetical protein [Chryseobacterium sp. T16E-39]ASK31777.1 hypothetical protein CEY12_17395 [Chryseobacterium sp. T16E-39]